MTGHHITKASRPIWPHVSFIFQAFFHTCTKVLTNVSPDESQGYYALMVLATTTTATYISCVHSTPKSSCPDLIFIACFGSMPINFWHFAILFVVTRGPDAFFLCAPQRPEFSTNFLFIFTYALDQICIGLRHQSIFGTLRFHFPLGGQLHLLFVCIGNHRAINCTFSNLRHTYLGPRSRCL